MDTHTHTHTHTHLHTHTYTHTHTHTHMHIHIHTHTHSKLSESVKELTINPNHSINCQYCAQLLRKSCSLNRVCHSGNEPFVERC